MNLKLKNTLAAILVPTLYAVALRLFFGIHTWDEFFKVMSLSFLFVAPVLIGILTTYLSDESKLYSRTYRFFAPWVPIWLFFFITILINLEGWACWIMIMPIFLLGASLGGFIGAYLKRRNQANRLQVSLLFLLPLIIAPVESWIGAIPGTYEAYTFIDIDAPAEIIWDNVTRVREITPQEDDGFLSNFLGFPRPVKAELDFEGVGAFRQAKFTNGLIFNETVTEYVDNRKMVFSIRANTYDIPSTTLDEHILIGGDYFDVLNGTYELEPIANGTYRLHLYSHFKMNTTFNFYAGWWGKLIMKDIQNNILRIEKKRSESK